MSKTDKRNDRSDYVYLNGSVESMAANASAIDREAILKAGAALKRDEASLDQMFDLHTAALRFRGPYAIALEREVNDFLATGEREGINEHLALKRDELRQLLRIDIETVVKEVEGD
jgi:hypothetical protein